MSNKTIDGNCYAKMLLGGAAYLSANTDEINAMNVFPVADGDTGTNMAKTLEGGLSEISSDENAHIGALSDSFAKGILLSARGNSGVILSQIFAGINECIASCNSVDACQLAKAYRNGIKKSYEAVQNPTEGTILTVFRESTEYAANNIDEMSDVEDFFKLHIEEAKRSLAATKEKLPALAEADVVDSGGAGYLCIAEGMYDALIGKMQTNSYKYEAKAEKSAINIDRFTRDSKLEFGYCTEFLLRLTTAKVDPDSFEIASVISILEELGGESIVAYKQGDIVKVHVHTFTPGDILSRVQAFGEFLTVKIENMSLGHSETEKVTRKNKNKLSTLAVASGEGMSALFCDMGAAYIIAGGQTKNPSIEEFIEAFDKCDSEDIIVLPNNKNIILAARQAAEIYEGARIHIIETRSLMQGYAALSVISPGFSDIEAIKESAKRAADNVVDAEITKAIRNVTIDGKSINAGDYIAISHGEISAVAATPESAVEAMLESIDMDDYELITLFVGKSVTADKRVELTERLEERYPECELTVYEGGQDVYDYLIAVE